MRREIAEEQSLGEEAMDFLVTSSAAANMWNWRRVKGAVGRLGRDWILGRH
jgi:hypothetical protein